MTPMGQTPGTNRVGLLFSALPVHGASRTASGLDYWRVAVSAPRQRQGGGPALLSKQTDEDLLVHLARQGDGQAFATLVGFEDAAVRRLVRGLVGPDEADDVVQSVYLKTWQGLCHFDGRSSFGTWLHRVAVNASLDHLRRNGTRPLMSAERLDVLPAAEPPDETGDPRMGALRWALRRAPREDRRLLKLRVQEGQSYQQIASHLGIAPSTVGTRLFRARARVRQLAQCRLAQLLAALLAGILAASSLGSSDALATLGLFLRRVVLRESVVPSSVEGVSLLRLRNGIDEAQTLVPWRVRVVEPPDGFVLADVFAGSIHSFAVGPTIWLHYRAISDSGGTRHLDVVQVHAARATIEPVEDGSAASIPLGDGRTALFIDGRWVSRGGSPHWYQGDTIRLILEAEDDDGVLIQLQGDPREGWDRSGLLQVARTLG